LERLNERIEQLGGPNAHPVVSLDLFFDENDDPASIGPNLDPHPGVRTFERVLKEIRDRPEVSDVVVQIDEVIEGEWPYAPAAYVISTASPQQVHEWRARSNLTSTSGKTRSGPGFSATGRPALLRFPKGIES
jgi:hypothetical protein